jgi:hypothetical protein
VVSELATKLNTKGVERKYIVLLILSHCEERIFPKGIKEVAGKHGFHKIKKWNVSQLLSDLGGDVSRYEDGWAINGNGKNKLSELGLSDAGPTAHPQVKLRQYLNQIKDNQTKQFVEEAVKSLEYNLLRSAIVLSWVGAVSLLQKEIISSHLKDFNNELIKRNSKAKQIRKLEDLELIKEYDVLQICRAVGMIGKNVKDELESCLKLRNACGHPNSLKIGEHRVASHIESLILNVYDVYA